MGLKEEAIHKEIELCEGLVDTSTEKLEEKEKYLQYVVDRLAVLNALDERLDGMVKSLNLEDIKNLSLELNRIRPEISKYKQEIGNMNKNIEALNDLLLENF